MKFATAFLAVFKGAEYCLTNKEIRKLAAWPWAVGSVCYIASLSLAYYLHPTLLAHFVAQPQGFWSSLVFYLAWVVVAALLLGASMILSIAMVMIFTSVFQSAIALKVLQELGCYTPPEGSGLRHTTSEVIRSILVESTKLIWLLPLMAITLLVGFIPVLLPLSVIGGAWLLAYQFLDVVLDIYRLGALKRFGFAASNGFFFCCFGLSLMLCWAVPFVGLMLPPAAVAGAAWLLATSGLLEPVIEKEKAKAQITAPAS